MSAHKTKMRSMRRGFGMADLYLDTQTHLPPDANRTKFDQLEFVDRMMGDEDLARRVAAAFVDDTMPKQLAALAKAIQNSDSRAIAAAAHTIKGAAANVGGVEIRDLAFQVEQLGAAESLAGASEFLPRLAASFVSLKSLIDSFRQGKGLIEPPGQCLQ